MLQCRLLTEHATTTAPVENASSMLPWARKRSRPDCAIDLRPEDTIAVASHDSIVSLVKGVALSDLVAQMYARRSKAGGRIDNIISSCVFRLGQRYSRQPAMWP